MRTLLSASVPAEDVPGRTGALEGILGAGIFLAMAPIAAWCERAPWEVIAGAVMVGALLSATRWYGRLTRCALLGLGCWLILLPVWAGAARFGWPTALALSAWTFVLGRVAVALPRTGGHRAAMMLAGLGGLVLLVAAAREITDPASARHLIAVGLYAVGWRLVLGLPEAALVALAPALAAMLIRLLALASVLPLDYLLGSGGLAMFAGGLILFLAAEQALSREREYPFRDFIFWRGVLPMLAPAWLWAPHWGADRIIDAARLLPVALAAGGVYVAGGAMVRAPISRGVGRVMWWMSLAGLAMLARFGDPAIGATCLDLPLLPLFMTRLDIGVIFMAAVVASLAGLLASAWRRMPPGAGDVPAWAVAGFAFSQLGAWLPGTVLFPGMLAGCVLLSLVASRHRLNAHRAAWAAGILLPALAGWDARLVLAGLVLAAASLLPGVVLDRFLGPLSPDIPGTPPPASVPTPGSSAP